MGPAHSLPRIPTRSWSHACVMVGSRWGGVGGDLLNAGDVMLNRALLVVVIAPFLSACSSSSPWSARWTATAATASSATSAAPSLPAGRRRRPAPHRDERAGLRTEPGARHRDEAGHHARVRRAERDGGHPRAARSCSSSATTPIPPCSPSRRARSPRRRARAAAPVRCPSTTTPVVAGDPPVSTTALVRGANAVLALLGNVGTPTMVRTAPIALETGTMFFGAFTGAAKILRDDLAGPASRYIFNVRASYAQEARATLEYFRSRACPTPHTCSSFDPERLVRAGRLRRARRRLQGDKGEFRPRPPTPAIPIARFRYTRDDAASVPAQVAAAADLPREAARRRHRRPHRRHLHDRHVRRRRRRSSRAAPLAVRRRLEQQTLNKATRLTLHFVNVSFVGPNALAERLVERRHGATPTATVPFTEHVVVSQVVPNYESDASDVVTRVQPVDRGAAARSPSFTSLEGYVAARVFVAGLSRRTGVRSRPRRSCRRSRRSPI